MYKKAKASFWTAKEIDLSRDITDWERLSPSEQHFISHVLAFFAASDGIVNKNLSGNFATEITSPEARCLYGFQIAVKNIHSTTYLFLIDMYIKDPSKKTHLLRAIETVPCILCKAQWALKWCNTATASFTERMIAFAAVKGIFFLGSFCAIFWLKKRGLMPGLCFSNELISRNEALHCDFACLLYLKWVTCLPKSRIVDIISSAVDIETEFVTDALRVKLIRMNSPMICNYIKFCAYRLLIALGCQCHYKIGNPFEWMEMISLQGKTNFFKKRVGEYSKLGGGVDSTAQVFSLNVSFEHTHTTMQHNTIPRSMFPVLCFLFIMFLNKNLSSHALLSKALQKTTPKHVQQTRNRVKSNDFFEQEGSISTLAQKQ
jgi:ribonucleoside-diphosphate reductase subunit M2